MSEILKVKLMSEDAKLPTKSYKGDTGWDVYSVENKVIHPNTQGEVDLGIAIEVPENYCTQFLARSSQRRKNIFITSGIVDSGYRERLSVFIMNLSPNDYVIYKGDKIAQIFILPNFQFVCQEVEELSQSERGTKGFGSSGK